MEYDLMICINEDYLTVESEHDDNVRNIVNLHIQLGHIPDIQLHEFIEQN